MITELKENEIFVFGSNALGYHSGGAARLAYEKFGAIWERADGIQGQSYAIPTLKKDFTRYTVNSLRYFVSDFLYYAQQHPENTFLLTPIGTGIAGFTYDEVTPLFAEAPPNVKKVGWKNDKH